MPKGNPPQDEYRFPTMWEMYDMIFQALEDGRATIREAREYHWIFLKGPSLASEDEQARLAHLQQKLGVGRLRAGALTGEGLVALCREARTDPDAEVMSRRVEVGEDGKKHIKIVFKFPDKPRKRGRHRPAPPTEAPPPPPQQQ